MLRKSPKESDIRIFNYCLRKLSSAFQPYGCKVSSVSIQKSSRVFNQSVAKSLSIFMLSSCSIKVNLLIEVAIRQFKMLICLWCVLSIKSAPSALRQSLATESPLKMMKNAFYFNGKLFSFSRYLSFCFDFLVMQQNGLIRKKRLI